MSAGKNRKMVRQKTAALLRGAFVGLYDVAMHNAVFDGNLDKVRRYHSKGFDVNGSHAGISYIETSIRQNHYTVLAYLVNHGARIVPEDIILAAQAADARIVSLAALCCPEGINYRDANGDTPLHWAIRLKNTAAIAALLDAGADPLTHEGGTTPYACAGDSTPEIYEMIKNRCASSGNRPATPAWHRIAADTIARVEECHALGYRLTEAFNFKERERTKYAQSLATGALSPPETIPYDVKDTTHWEEAFEKYTMMTGASPPLTGKTSLPRKKGRL